ncbi:MAG: cytochrome C oxidase subunit IV family protein [Chloroflexi bacterium]|nr:cytochrome C oxidase subunit IV family protein [Chloroflexota bacterium]
MPALEAPRHVEEHHPKPALYAGIFVVLFILTALEVGVTYFPEIPQVPVLLTLALAKGALIVLFYMHLKFDSRVFSTFFLVGLILAVSLIVTLMALFFAHEREPFDQAAAARQTQGQTATGAGS